MILSENKIKDIIKEAINNVLNENYSNNGLQPSRNSVIPENRRDLLRLESLVNAFTDREINFVGGSEEVDWNDFIEGIHILHCMAKEKVDYDKYNFKELYQNYVKSGNDDDFFFDDNVRGYDYLDEYFGDEQAMNFWDKYMPTPEEVAELSKNFVEWLKIRTESDIEEYSRNKWYDYRYISNYLNNKIY